jgi:hypothetical protein
MVENSSVAEIVSPSNSLPIVAADFDGANRTFKYVFGSDSQMDRYSGSAFDGMILE